MKEIVYFYVIRFFVVAFDISRHYGFFHILISIGIALSDARKSCMTRFYYSSFVFVELLSRCVCTIGGVGRWSQFGVATHCSFGRTSVAHRRSSNPEHGYVDEAYLPIEPSRFRDVGASY